MTATEHATIKAVGSSWRTVQTENDATMTHLAQSATSHLEINNSSRTSVCDEDKRAVKDCLRERAHVTEGDISHNMPSFLFADLGKCNVAVINFQKCQMAVSHELVDDFRKKMNQ